MASGRFLLAVCAVLFTVNLGLLASGSDLLIADLSPTPIAFLPAGTFIGWGMLLGLGGLAYLTRPSLAAESGRLPLLVPIARFLAVAGLALDALWVLVGVALAGNWAFNFAPGEGFVGTPTAGRLFWGYSAGCLALPLLSLIASGLNRPLASKANQK